MNSYSSTSLLKTCCLANSLVNVLKNNFFFHPNFSSLNYPFLKKVQVHQRYILQLSSAGDVQFDLSTIHPILL